MAEPTGGKPKPAGRLARFWERAHRGDSVGWLLCTILQGLLTWVFIGLSELSVGWAWEVEAKLLVLLAIVATWGMALRTIRARIVELLRYWRDAQKRKKPEEWDERDERRQAVRTAYVRSSMLRLRIIAAGITMPFFLLPAFVSVTCVGICLWEGILDSAFLGSAMVLSAIAAIVGTYFHWAIVPAPSTARRFVRERAARRADRTPVG